ncbi:desmoplakin-A-like isoform X2 [Mya arenaria]|uniref:desmoplakin-A-like isoform X2 n=1 Tax=Mya arenaria TaxID=6604 RepID=UPI0022E462C4|nr:desmoplakin-A-like isoform X2 [Mya arenaria]
MYENDGCNPRRILCDIIQKMCTHHPTERTALFCKTHETLICGRCLQSDHVSSCGGYDVDMCKDATHINCDPANDTTVALYIIRDIAGDIKQMKKEIDQRIETNNTNVVKGNKELDSLEIKLKGNVKDSKRGFSQETCTTNDFNLDANSMGSASQEMQMTRNELIEASIKAKLDAEKAEIARKRLEKESLQAKQRLEKTEKTRKELCDELKHVKHDLETSEKTRNKYDRELLQSKNVIEQGDKTRQELCNELKLVKQYLENSEKTRKQHCDELKQQLDTSEKTRQSLRDELKQVKHDLETSEKTRNTYNKELLQSKNFIEQCEKTRQELCNELKLVKQDLDDSEKTREQQSDELKQELDISEKTRQKLCEELERVKKDLDNSEKTRNALCDELKQVKQDKDILEKARNAFCDELKQVKQDKDNSDKKRQIFEQELLKAKQGIEESEKERAVLKEHIPHLKNNIKWTQPTGTVEVKDGENHFGLPFINLSFTFSDGIQTAHHPTPGCSYKGDTFTGYLYFDSEGEGLCRMFKAAFRRGLMFNLEKKGRIVLNGVSLFTGLSTSVDYYRYTRTLKEELSAKGITEKDINQTEKLYKSLTVDGSYFCSKSAELMRR